MDDRKKQPYDAFGKCAPAEDKRTDDDYIRRGEAKAGARHAWAKGLEPTQYIDLIPAADVVEVVRCKECTFWDREQCPKDAIDADNRRCEMLSCDADPETEQEKEAETMNSRTIIALLGIIACALLYGEQRLSIRECGRRSKTITALIWLIVAATVAAMIASNWIGL